MSGLHVKACLATDTALKHGVLISIKIKNSFGINAIHRKRAQMTLFCRISVYIYIYIDFSRALTGSK